MENRAEVRRRENRPWFSHELAIEHLIKSAELVLQGEAPLPFADPDYANNQEGYP